MADIRTKNNQCMKKKPREKDGKFKKFSKLGNKVVSTRFYKEDEELLLKVAEEEGITPVELNRKVIREWARSLAVNG